MVKEILYLALPWPLVLWVVRGSPSLACNESCVLLIVCVLLWCPLGSENWFKHIQIFYVKKCLLATTSSCVIRRSSLQSIICWCNQSQPGHEGLPARIRLCQIHRKVTSLVQGCCDCTPVVIPGLLLVAVTLLNIRTNINN